MTLKVYYSNINDRKAFSLFLVFSLYNHALPLDHTQGPHTHEIFKNSVLGMNELRNDIESLLFNYKSANEIYLVMVLYL